MLWFLRICWVAVLFGGLCIAQQLPVRVRVHYARIVSKVDPVYPEAAKKKGTQGTVRLEVVVGTDGHVINASRLSGNRELSAAAMDAVKQWVYVPTLLNQTPIEVITEVEVRFVL